MEHIVKDYMHDRKIIFPSYLKEHGNTFWLADRLVYDTPGDLSAYLYASPVFVCKAKDSTLHENHVAFHQEARNVMQKFVMETHVK